MKICHLSITSAISLWFIVVLLGCERKRDITPFVYKPPVIKTFRDSIAPTPTLLSVKIEGIPAANIRIDSAKRTIYVTVPPDVPTATPVAEFVVSPWSRVRRPAEFAQSPIRLILGQQYEPIELVYTRVFQLLDDQIYPNDPVPIVYRILYVPAGDMAIGPELSAEVGQPVYLPIRNFYDSVATSAIIRLTSVADGRVIEGIGQIQHNSYFQPIPASKVAFTSTDPIGPGEYTVEVVKERGQLRRRLSGARITLRPGRPVLDKLYNIVAITDRGEVTLKAFNLYAESPVDLELVSQTGTRLLLKPTRYAPDGSRVIVPLPTDAPSEYYLVRFIRAGQVVGFSRLVLTPDQNTPRIRDIVGTDFTTPSEAPIVLKRNSPVTVTTSLLSAYDTRIRLVNVADPQKEYLLGPPTPREIAYCYECGWVSLRDIPLTSVPPGRYHVSIRPGNQAGGLVDIGPIERIVQIE